MTDLEFAEQYMKEHGVYNDPIYKNDIANDVLELFHVLQEQNHSEWGWKMTTSIFNDIVKEIIERQ